MAESSVVRIPSRDSRTNPPRKGTQNGAQGVQKVEISNQAPDAFERSVEKGNRYREHGSHPQGGGKNDEGGYREAQQVEPAGVCIEPVISPGIVVGQKIHQAAGGIGRKADPDLGQHDPPGQRPLQSVHPSGDQQASQTDSDQKGHQDDGEGVGR